MKKTHCARIMDTISATHQPLQVLERNYVPACFPLSASNSYLFCVKSNFGSLYTFILKPPARPVNLHEAIKDTWKVVVFVESKNVRVVDGIIYSLVLVQFGNWTYVYMIVVYGQCPFMPPYRDFTLNDPLHIWSIKVG